MCKFTSKSGGGGVPFQPLGDLTWNDPLFTYHLTWLWNKFKYLLGNSLTYIYSLYQSLCLPNTSKLYYSINDHNKNKMSRKVNTITDIHIYQLYAQLSHIGSCSTKY